MTIVDFHLHVTRGEEYLRSVKEGVKSLLEWQDPGSSVRQVLSREGIIQFLDENGLDYAVALAELGYASTVLSSNEEVAEFCRGLDRLIPFANLNPFLVSRPAEHLERYVKEMGFRGLKLHPSFHLYYPNDPMMYPVYAKAEALGIPVLIHTGSSTLAGSRLKYGDPLYLDDVAVDFPHLKIIQAHGGRGFWYDRALFLTRLHQNLYLEISGLPPHKLLTYFPDLEKSADKVLFGSDWPGPPIKANIEAIRTLPLTEDTKEKILGGNARSILGLREEVRHAGR
jgi:hypothetical protein